MPKTPPAPLPFWQRKTLAEMDVHEWESLCDGCARCCMVKLEDESTQAVHYTRIACRLLDTTTCRCRDYPKRSEKVPDCMQVHAQMGEQFNWLPDSCAYRRLHEGRDLPDWHPLLSKTPNGVHTQGISMRGRCVSEDNVHPSLYAEQCITFDSVD